MAPSRCRSQLSLASVQRLGDAAEDSLSKKPEKHMRGVLAGDRGTDHTQQRAKLIHGAERGEVMPNQALLSLIQSARCHCGDNAAGVDRRRRNLGEQFLLPAEEPPDECGVHAGVGRDLTRARRLITCLREAPGRRHYLPPGIPSAWAASGSWHSLSLISANSD